MSKCQACNRQYERFCMDCYERVVREKPLDAWKQGRYKRAGYVPEMEADEWIRSLEDG